jgi:zinc finger RNA-binding protein
MMLEESSGADGGAQKIPAGCNPSDVLYKLAHSRGIKPPVFEMISEQGPPHARTYTWSCSFWDGKYQTMAAGRSKKEAKNAVAKALLDQIDLTVLPTKNNSHKQHNRVDKKRKAPLDGVAGAEGGKPFGGGPWGPGPQHPMPGKFRFQQFGRFGHMMRPKNSKEDHYVIVKHREIYPQPQELGIILKLAETTERALKRVSDKFANQEDAAKVKQEDGTQMKVEKMEGADEPKENGDGKHEYRDILGVARTGDLAKGLLLTGDKAVDLVVMCSKKPTLTLLNKVLEGLKEEVKTIPENEKKGKTVIEDGELQVLPKPRDAAILIKLKREEHMYSVTVTLTSTKLRQSVTQDENGKVSDSPADDATADKEVNIKKEKEEDPHDILPKDKCLNALAELRRAKWFSTMAAPLESCVESIRIFREICRRVEAWTPLSNWAIELLVERAVSTADTLLSPSLALSRVLEVVCSGIIAADGPGLKDPCEREVVDVVANLDPQQRDDLQATAQQFLRKLHFRKIHEMLDLEELPPKGKKSGEGVEPEAKKPKKEGEN